MQYRELWTTCPFPQHCTGSLTCSAAVLLRTVQVIKVPSLATQNLKTIHPNLPLKTFLALGVVLDPYHGVAGGSKQQQHSPTTTLHFNQLEVSLKGCSERGKVRYQPFESILMHLHLYYRVIKGCFSALLLLFLSKKIYLCRVSLTLHTSIHTKVWLLNYLVLCN